MYILPFLVFLATLFSTLTPFSTAQKLETKSVELERTPDLMEFKSDEMSQMLLTKLKQDNHWNTLISNHKMAVSLVDLSNSERPMLAEVNGDDMMYAASLPKIAILLAGMDALEKGDLEYSEEIEQDMRSMICNSSNPAACRMIDRVGFDRIEDVLTDPDNSLYDVENGGGLWVGKHYGKCQSRHPDPLKNLSHAATTNQVARFYYKMAKGELINEECSKQMLAYMADPELHHKFVNTLDKTAPNAKVYRKSGTWRTYHADSVLVVDGKKRNYILVALIDDPNGEAICRRLVTVAENVLKTTKPNKTVRS